MSEEVVVEEKKIKKKNLITKSTSYQILYWCISEYGRSKLNGRYPHIKFLKEGETENDYGYFDDIESTIYLCKNKILTLEDLARTIIHEYTHYCKHSMAEYKVLSKYLSYARNPLEVDARRVESRDFKKCLKFLKKEHNIYE